MGEATVQEPLHLKQPRHLLVQKQPPPMESFPPSRLETLG